MTETTNNVYTLGYSGRKFDELVDLVHTQGAILIDIRMSPKSRIPHWNPGPLQKALGKQYRHLPALGNVNFRGTVEEIKIQNMSLGTHLVKQELAERPVILMCACKDWHECHRTVVANELRRQGVEVIELNETTERPKPRVPQAQQEKLF